MRKKQWICKGCDKEFFGRDNLAKHVKNCEEYYAQKIKNYKISNIKNSFKAKEYFEKNIENKIKWKEKLSKNISNSILDNKKEIKRRKSLIKKLNKKYFDLYQKNRSETAKKHLNEKKY